MDNWLIQVVVAIVASLPGILALIASRNRTRAEESKIKAEAADIVADSAVQVMTQTIAPLQKRIEELERRVSQLECENRALRNENAGFSATIDSFRNLIRVLWEGVITLSAQLEDGMLSPGWHLEQYRQAVEMALRQDTSKRGNGDRA